MSVKSRVESGECGVWSVNEECGVWSELCKVWGVGFKVWSVQCGV